MTCLTRVFRRAEFNELKAIKPKGIVEQVRHKGRTPRYCFNCNYIVEQGPKSNAAHGPVIASVLPGE